LVWFQIRLTFRPNGYWVAAATNVLQTIEWQQRSIRLHVACDYVACNTIEKSMLCIWFHYERRRADVAIQSRMCLLATWFARNCHMFCYFVSGFIGVDCSISTTQAPVITGIRNGPTCDLHGIQPCTFVSLFVQSFTLSGLATARFVSTNEQSFYFNYRFLSLALLNVVRYVAFTKAAQKLPLDVRHFFSWV